MNLYTILMIFFCYSILGWCAEVVFAAVTHGKVVNRGFLNGTWCPIYGVGMVFVLGMLGSLQENGWVLFFAGMLICTLVELVAGWLLEKFFHTRWWDYTREPFNIGGYICPKCSLMWGFAVLLVVRMLHPTLMALLMKIPHTIGIVILCVLSGLFAVDFAVTLKTIIGIQKELKELEKIADALHELGDNVSQRLGTSALRADEKLEEMKEASQKRKEEYREQLQEARESLEERLESSYQERLEHRRKLEEQREALLMKLREHPGVGHRRINGAFPALRESIRERIEKYGKDQ